MKYFAYGMNTNLTEMARRCPSARSLGAAQALNHQFEFKMFATVVPSVGVHTEGVLWDITDGCEQALDRLEGYPAFYNKKSILVKHNGSIVRAMTYLMYPEEELNYPSNSYVTMLEEGYIAHGIELNQIDRALMDLDYFYNEEKWLTNQPNDSTIMTSWRSHLIKE